MDDSWSIGMTARQEANFCNVGILRQQARHHGSRSVPGSWVHDEVGGFVDYEETALFTNNLYLDVRLWFDADRSGSGHDRFEAVSLMEDEAAEAIVSPIDEDRALSNEPSCFISRDIGQHRQRPVEANTAEQLRDLNVEVLDFWFVTHSELLD
jgi:hypothetical protein